MNILDNLNLKLKKNHIFKKFGSIFKNYRNLEINIINKKIFAFYWDFKFKRLRKFIYNLPDELSVCYQHETKNKISGLKFNIVKVCEYEIVLTRIRILYNLILGIIDPHKRVLEIYGTGFKFNIINETYYKPILEVFAGFNESKKVEIPNDICLVEVQNNYIVVCSHNKQILTEFCALIKKIKPLNRYKLRGIKLKEEKFIPKTYKKK